jgi:hypothetical protein
LTRDGCPVSPFVIDELARGNLRRRDLHEITLKRIWLTTRANDNTGNAMKPLLRFFRLSPRSMPDMHGNDNETARAKRIAGIRALLAEIAVEPPPQECCREQDNGRARRARSAMATAGGA